MTESYGTCPDNPALSGKERFVLVFLLVVAAGIWTAKVAFGIANGSSLDHSSGVWTNLALDLAHGTFYRPIFDEEMGFGGTRYLPLFFCLHAALIRLGGDPIISGHVLTVGSGLLLLGTCYLFLRRLGVAPLGACVVSAAILGSHNVQYTLATIRGDLLPVGLNLGGLLVFLSPWRAKIREPLTALLFVLAFAAKLTAVHGLAALFLWLLLNGRTREALRVLLWTAAGCLVLVLGLYLATSGRILTVFQTCSLGGAKLTMIAKMPVLTARLIQDDAVCLLLLFGAVAVLCCKSRTLITSLPCLFWLVSLLITTVIFGSPGTFINHLVDLTAASALLLGYSVDHVLSHQKRPFAYVAAFFLMFFALYFSVGLQKQVDQYRKHDYRYPPELVAWFQRHDGPILSEDPLIPIMAHRAPYISDPFMLRIIFQKNAALKAAVMTQIKEKKFSAIIFIENPRIFKQWYAQIHLGPEFRQTVLDHYDEARWTGRFYVYQPRGGTDPGPRRATVESSYESPKPKSGSWRSEETNVAEKADAD